MASPRFSLNASQDLPPAPPFKKLIGPSFILLGLGLGSGEIILWPYLTSNHGLGLVWGILVGITIQFFINMEVERYALIYGESIFVGFARWLKWLPLWFILSTLLGFGWPGIGLAGASLLSNAFDTKSLSLVGTIIFLAIGVILSVGTHIYKTVESLQKTLILVGSPALIVLAIYLAKSTDWQALFSGLIGIGDGYFGLPVTISFSSFLGALAFSGAGGNLNLGQSFYVRDKGYGMGHYADKISSFFTKNTSKEVTLVGRSFPQNAKNLREFSKWWKLVNLEHLFVFWFLGLITMLTLALLAFSTAYGLPNNPSGLNFVINEARIISQLTFPFFGTIFLFLTGLMLSATQLTVLDSTSRIITENLLLLKGTRSAKISKLYYIVLWTQISIGLGIIFLGFTQPRELITISAVINAFTMAVYSLLLVIFNNTRLPHNLKPSLPRSLVLSAASIFFFSLTALTLIKGS